jgi:REP element-mobilizing transposase RayT
VPRDRRPTAAGVYHVITTSTTPDEFFRDDFDRIEFLNLLERAVQRFGWTCVGVCLMTTHYHLILEVPENGLSVAMKWLNWKYAHAFNRRYTRRGHHVGSRFTAIPIEDESQLLTAYRYVARNPVRAGICKRPQDWPWSSYAATVGLAPGFSFVDAKIVFSCFEGEGAVVIERLRGYVESTD